MEDVCISKGETVNKEVKGKRGGIMHPHQVNLYM